MRRACLDICGIFDDSEKLLAYLEDELKNPPDLSELKFF